jgi:hypothetical protein
MLSKWAFVLGAVGLNACAGSQPDAVCAEEQYVISVDEPGPWDESANEVFDPALGMRVGTIEWRGGGDFLNVLPSGGTTDLEVRVESIADEATVTERSPINTGPHERLYCWDRMEMNIRLQVNTADGVLDDALTGSVVHDAGELFVVVDLLAVEFSGTLEVEPKEGVTFDEHGLFLVTQPRSDSVGQMDGRMFYGTPRDASDGDEDAEQDEVVWSFAEISSTYP